ncbi:MAG: CDP-diacylglycerol--glycerol-3-phosphate 3-phosphatidyltransferase [Syntrophaceae bacterium CG2_30_49_12]|nr:MAG: CDP-diacylglycerol--glycerol-3-phosphate 3-phosphatidyltransferase [Syntrophaceae bacterium CG2_30_49_12]PIP05789.1 MAG: CDP-diacylglycerol--glycerol-3-phosphate 3-phosphatidyltransferase [Syntrophobacterales bacterium CG23_combo_of_CG06-09_8_20_14_all_48_27]PJC74643.1 MAG: CDP-diacylglycerol--glycerol-3-phosphate 3-phosphatidyltransferase [Syntrophobacterales bacterium CG_4_8_14_3_um_filter_49_14]
MNIPNFLSLLRIILVPAVVIFLMQGSFSKALIFFTVSGITDAMDGFLARILKQQTIIGSYLDPIADKALLVSCFLALSIMGIIPGWLTVIVISRDIIILVGVSIFSMMAISFEIHPTFVSKVTTVLQIFTVLLVLLFKCKCILGSFDYMWVMLFYWFTALFTVISGLNYIARGVKLINNQAP